MTSMVRLAELRRRQGRSQDAEALLERANMHPLAWPVRAALALDRGDLVTALDLLDTLLRRATPSARTERITALELKTVAHAGLGQLDQAQKTAAELEAIAEIIDTEPLRASSLAASGKVAAATSEHEQAKRLFEDAAYLFESSGSRYEAARVRLDLARCLAKLGRLSAAVAETSVALAIFEAMGAAADGMRARELLAHFEPRAEASSHSNRHNPAGGGPLTRRQREILTLIAQGLSDHDIATRLFLSEHTVHRHVANILTRLDVSSRTAAVARALRADLL